MRKIAIVVATAIFAATLGVSLTGPPAVTLTVLSVTHGEFTSLFTDTNFLPTVATLQMKNNSKASFEYSAFFDDPALPHFSCYYWEADKWVKEAPQADSERQWNTYWARHPNTGFTGALWIPAVLKPGDAITFQAYFPNSKRTCKIAVEYKRKTALYDHLPYWLVRRLPWAGTRLAETKQLPKPL